MLFRILIMQSCRVRSGGGCSAYFNSVFLQLLKLLGPTDISSK